MNNDYATDDNDEDQYAAEADDEHTCDVCGEPFESATELEEHVENAHTDQG